MKTTPVPLKRKARRRYLRRVIELTWGSLESHLDRAVKVKRRASQEIGDANFHAVCIREYAEVIYITALELEALNK